jgi:pimeloyl-ACP methyl ester carboxylesterase
LRLHYYRTGGNKPQVVFNHGAGDDGLCWTHIVKELEQDYDVILADARGHGKSESGKGDYSTRQRVADLAGFVQALKLDRPVVGGHSMGADASMHFAANYPGLTRGIFLEDPPIILPGEIFGSGEQVMDPKEIGRMMAKFMRLFKIMPRFIGVRMARKGMPAYPDDELLPWLDSKKRLSFDFLSSMAGMEIDIAAPFEVIGKIRVPILLFIGDKEKMSIMSQDAARKASEANARLQVVHLEGASHDIRRTRFDGYMPALKDFLAEIYRA